MARPERHDADYFPFYAKRGRTLNILQSRFGLEGIGFFTNLWRFLTLTPDHYYCIKDDMDRMNLFSEIGMNDEEKGIKIIELLTQTKKLDRELWEEFKVIVSQDHLDSLLDAYKNRKNKIITIDEIKARFVSYRDNPVSYPNNPVSYSNLTTETELPSEIEGHNPQRKGKERKLKDNNVNSEATPPAFPENPSSSKPEKTKKAPLREREPANDMERVEKAYLLNWDTLYSQGKVKAINPVVNWNQTRKLLKTHFENLDVKLIIQAVNNALNDEWVLNAGYSLGIMLSASVLNRLINAGQGHGPSQSIQFGELSEGTVDIPALYKQFGLTGSEQDKRRKLIELRDKGEVSF
jgi:hypothetical protein